MYPKLRLDALTDGIFGVAMTILVLDIKLPEEFHPTSNAEMVNAILALWNRFFPYVLSFVVLGMSWLSSIKVRTEAESVGRPYAGTLLIYLLLVTCVPFSTLLVGRFAAFEAATAVYAVNLGLMAFVGYRLLSLTPNPQLDAQWHDRRIAMIVLMVSCALTLLVGLFAPRHALWCLMLNFAQRPITSWYLGHSKVKN
jgi:TMEM175 potassium channel family protein